MKEREGFTIVEMIVSIGILFLIGSISIGVYTAFRLRNTFAVVEEQIVSFGREAQQRARAQVLDTDWGFFVSSSAVTVFSGSSFATRDIAQDIVATFPNSIVVSTTEVIFASSTGRPFTSTTISFTYDQLSSAITIDSFGIFHR